MKLQNYNLLMTVAAIDLTETEMEGLVGGLFTTDTYTAFWNLYNDKSQNKTDSINNINSLIQNEIKTNPQDIEKDVKNLGEWLKANPSALAAIKKDQNIKEAFRAFGTSNKAIADRINQLLG